MLRLLVSGRNGCRPAAGAATYDESAVPDTTNFSGRAANAKRAIAPNTQAPPAQTRSSEKVECQIIQQLRAEPALSSTNVNPRVDDNSVVLTGSVDTMAQHDLVVRIAQANVGDRKIVDKINIKQQT
jgi:osmotically-inducible protein OsmY